MKKGVNAWCFPHNLGLRDMFSIAKKAGFNTIELNMDENKPIQHPNIVNVDLNLKSGGILTTDSTEEDIARIRAVSKEFDIPISSISTSLHWTYPLSSPDRAIREKGKSIALKMIKACSLLGGDTVLIVPGLVTEDNSYDECYRLSKESLKEISTYAEQMKIKVGIENVWNKFLLSPLEMNRFIDEIDSPYLGVYFDAGNVLQIGYPEQWVSILGRKIFKVHVKDFRKEIGNIHGFTNLLLGDLNWEKLMNALKRIGYNGPLTCELEPYHENPLQLAVDTSNAMDYILSL